VRNLEHLIERMLVAAELESGAAAPGADDVIHGRALLEAAAAFHGRLSPTHELVVEADGPLAVWGDQRSLDLIIDNLVENAIKYSPAGGSVVLSGRQRSGWIDLAVDDEGVGLPADTDRLFERFAQREGVETRVHDEGGVGLGLYIVRSLVSSLGGSVRAERRPDKGARFVVTLRAAVVD
jgi:signal transduction histidine kinase